MQLWVLNPSLRRSIKLIGREGKHKMKVPLSHLYITIRPSTKRYHILGTNIEMSFGEMLEVL